MDHLCASWIVPGRCSAGDLSRPSDSFCATPHQLATRRRFIKAAVARSPGHDDLDSTDQMDIIAGGCAFKSRQIGYVGNRRCYRLRVIFRVSVLTPLRVLESLTADLGFANVAMRKTRNMSSTTTDPARSGMSWLDLFISGNIFPVLCATHLTYAPLRL